MDSSPRTTGRRPAGFPSRTGLRYDVEAYPGKFILEKDLNNVQPRVGAAFAYSPRGVIRGGYGLFFDRLASSVGQLFNATEWSTAGSLPNAQLLFPTISPLPARFQQRTVGGAAAPVAARNFLLTGQVPTTSSIGLADTLDGTVQTPYSHQASAQITHEVGRGIAVSAGYLFLGARQIIGHTGNLNAFQTGVLASGKPIYGGRTYPEVGDLFVQTNTGISNYHGGTFEVEKRFAGGVAFHGSYTLSSVRNNVDSLANLADLPEGQDITGEMARSRQDVRHRLTVTALTQVPSAGRRRRRRESERAGVARKRTAVQHLRGTRLQSRRQPQLGSSRRSSAATRTRGRPTRAWTFEWGAIFQ